MSLKKRFVVCLDGTWNNPYVESARDDGSKVFKPSNVLKVARAVVPETPTGVVQIAYYDVGVGALNRQPGASNRLLRFLDNKLGGAWGAGFEGHIEQAYGFLAHNFEERDELFVFGFSRGAAEARSLCQFIEWMGGFLQKADLYYAPRFFLDYLARQGQGSAASLCSELGRRLRRPILPARVRFLGVWDSVLALGSRLRARTGTAVQRRMFHAGETPPDVVDVARQALAIDERRYDFRPEIWRAPSSPTQSLEQRWFAGAHSNVGGGYVQDGLANLALHWLVNEAETVGLVLDREYLAHYRGYAMDKLYDSHGLGFRIREVLTLSRSLGRRDMRVRPHGPLSAEANLTIDPSVLQRLSTDPNEVNQAGELKHPRLNLYRPETLIQYLATRRDLDSQLPHDVLQRVIAFRE